MIDKSKITRGKQAVPLKVLVLGSEGVGKTTFAAGAPRPFVIDLDRGSYEQDVARVEAETFDDVLEWCEHARMDPEVETLVIDSLSRLEAMVAVKVCGPSDMGGLAAFGGGYGKGDDAALQYWRHFLAVMDRVSATKNVVLVGHTAVKAYNDPIGLAFDKHSLGLREKAAGPIKQWVNYTLYARTEVSTRVHDKTKKSLGITTGARYIYTDNNPAYDAKHRGNLPAQLPLSWQAFADAVAADRSSCAEKLALIATLLERVDGATAAKVKVAAKSNEANSVQLAAIIGRLQSIIDTNEANNETNETNETKAEKKS